MPASPGQVITKRTEEIQWAPWGWEGGSAGLRPCLPFSRFISCLFHVNIVHILNGEACGTMGKREPRETTHHTRAPGGRQAGALAQGRTATGGPYALPGEPPVSASQFPQPGRVTKFQELKKKKKKLRNCITEGFSGKSKFQRYPQKYISAYSLSHGEALPPASVDFS